MILYGACKTYFAYRYERMMRREHVVRKERSAYKESRSQTMPSYVGVEEEDVLEA